jgi:hypothetical protein
MAAADLEAAAFEAFDDMYTRLVAATVRADVLAFCAAALPIFPDSSPNGRPVANWITILNATAQEWPSSAATLLLADFDQFAYGALVMFKLCYIAFEFDGTQITSQQATALLAVYNAHIA